VASASCDSVGNLSLPPESLHSGLGRLPFVPHSRSEQSPVRDLFQDTVHKPSTKFTSGALLLFLTTVHCDSARFFKLKAGCLITNSTRSPSAESTKPAYHDSDSLSLAEFVVTCRTNTQRQRDFPITYHVFAELERSTDANFIVYHLSRLRPPTISGSMRSSLAHTHQPRPLCMALSADQV